MSEDQFLQSALNMRSKLYHVARAILWNDQDAADAMQEAMLRGWKHRNTLRDEAKFESWLMQILVNQCRTLQRKRMREKGLLSEITYRAKTDAPSSQEDAFETLRVLPEALRLPALLYYEHGYSQKEIAQILGLTGEQVKSRVRRAREKMRGMMEEGGVNRG